MVHYNCENARAGRNKSFKINESSPRNLLRRLGKPAPFLIPVVVARWPERMKRHERHANTFDDHGGVSVALLPERRLWSRGVARWFRWSLSVFRPRQSVPPPCFRFHTPLIEPDARICRIRLSEKTHAIAEAIVCDAVCNF